MRLSFCATFLIASELFAQSVYIPPRARKMEPTIVSMSIGDNVVPLIELGENGPTVVTFPGRIQQIIMQHKAYDWSPVGVISVKSNSGEEQILSQVVFTRMAEMTPAMKDFLSLPDNYITAVALYQYKGRTYTHDIDLTWRPSSRRSSVSLVPVIDGLPSGSVIEALKREFSVKKGDETFDKPEVRNVADRKSGRTIPTSESQTKPNVDVFKRNGFKYGEST